MTDPKADDKQSDAIVVYGTSWCPDCHRVRHLLQMNQISYVDIDIDRNEIGLNFVKKINHGNRSVPTLLFPDGSILVEPSNKALAQKLGLLKV